MRAKLALGLVLALLAAPVVTVVSLGWILASALFGDGRRAKRIVMAWNQLLNATAGGDEDEQMSARFWRRRNEPWRRFVDRLFFVVADESDHCRRAFENERARRQRPYERVPD